MDVDAREEARGQFGERADRLGGSRFRGVVLDEKREVPRFVRRLAEASQEFAQERNVGLVRDEADVNAGHSGSS